MNLKTVNLKAKVLALSTSPLSEKKKKKFDLLVFVTQM